MSRLSLFIARRYLFSPKSHSVINLISALSVVAVAVPVAAIIILLSVFNGLEHLVRDNYSEFDADLTLTPLSGTVFEEGSLPLAELRATPGVAAASCILEQSVLLECDGRQATTTLRGVDSLYYDVFPFRTTVLYGHADVEVGERRRVIVGQAMASMLGIRQLGDCEVNAYTLKRKSFSPLLPAANYTRRSIAVGGIYVIDLDTEKNYAVAPLSFVRELTAHENRLSAVVIRTAEGHTPREVRRALQEVAGDGFRITTREEMRASLYRIMLYEKWGIFIVSLLVLLVASFSVVGALVMLVVEKRADMQTLRALGGDTSLLRAVFRQEGLLICSLGGLAGVVTGVVLTLVQEHFGLIEIPADTFLTKSYPVELRWGDLLLVVISFAGVSRLLTGITVRSLIHRHEFEK